MNSLFRKVSLFVITISIITFRCSDIPKKTTTTIKAKAPLASDVIPFFDHWNLILGDGSNVGIANNFENKDFLYTSNDEKINIKEVRIIDNEGDGKIDACTIIKKTESPLSNWMQTISFTPKEKKLEILNELDK